MGPIPPKLSYIGPSGPGDIGRPPYGGLPPPDGLIGSYGGGIGSTGLPIGLLSGVGLSGLKNHLFPPFFSSP